MRDGKLTVAGALLFASDPSAMMPQARVLRYDGTRAETGKRLNITKERVFCGPLPRVHRGRILAYLRYAARVPVPGVGWQVPNGPGVP